MQFAFFETALRAQKSYSRLMEPVCKKWNLTHNELDAFTMSTIAWSVSSSGVFGS